MAAVVVDRPPSHLTEFALLEKKLMFDTQVKGSASGKRWDEIICSHELHDVMLFFFPDLPALPPGAKFVGIPPLAKLEIAGNPPVIVHTLGILVV